MWCLYLKGLKLVLVLILLQGLQETLSDKIPLNHRRRVLNKTAENFPSRLTIAFPLDLEFNVILGLLLIDSVSNDALNSIPSPFF